MNKLSIIVIALLLPILLLGLPLAGAFSGLGSGTVADPYQIINWTTLNETNLDLEAH